MSISEKSLGYRGDVKAAVGIGGTLAFVTQHAEGQPTGLFRLDADTLTLDTDPLPDCGLALAADGETIWVAGGDARIYEGSARGGKPKVRGEALAAAATALVPLADDRLAVLSGSEIAVLARKAKLALVEVMRDL
ncbi:MAG: hypothetical protein QOE66_1812, partial [Chloroflexota bacterium]|nr:hypothetical protein [Chloroflexota bacterium]